MNDPKEGTDTELQARSTDVPPAQTDTREAEERIKAQLLADAAKRKRKAMLLVGLIAVALAILALEIRHYYFGPEFPSTAMSANIAIEVFDPVGSPEAKVKVVVLLERCLESVQSIVHQIGACYPELVRAEFYPIHSEGAQPYVKDQASACAGVLVNGEDHFTVSEGGQSKDVHFYMNPGTSYTEKDLVAVIKREMQAAYGSVPEDFDQRVSTDFASGIPPLGMPDAQVHVHVCLQKPNGQLVDLLARIGNAFPSQVRVEFPGYTSPRAGELLANADEGQPCVLVNLKTTWGMSQDGTAKQVSLRGAPGEAYTLADVVTAIKAELVAVHESVPPAFDEVAALPEQREPTRTPRAAGEAVTEPSAGGDRE